MSSGVSDQVRLKLASSATEASMRLESLVTETGDITLSRQGTTKALIRLIVLALVLALSCKVDCAERDVNVSHTKHTSVLLVLAQAESE